MQFYLRYFMTVAFLIVFSVKNVLALDSGAYTSSPGKRMDLSSVSHWFTYNFPVTAPPIHGAVITKVYYQYALGQSDISHGTLVVNLCSTETARCVDISDSKSGELMAFQGEDASSHFFIYYKLINHQETGLVTGNGQTQLTVNWVYNK
ncbi:flagellar protein FlhE [Salmonella enterica]|nr:flagellar protein FlhE [Salmonella enterica]EIK0391326.1 flagellar protein FlhE [Salmonella enterica]